MYAQLEGLYDCGCGDEGKATSSKSGCLHSDEATFELMVRPHAFSSY